ncbi:hypothetical protein GCM10009682_52400 [Luedemannella flava]|uniref:Uncharacterized protein n=1 Tax=Luedemannella flava TaxID=349316 RepID=A0ABN2MG89_9ACTN
MTCRANRNVSAGRIRIPAPGITHLEDGSAVVPPCSRPRNPRPAGTCRSANRELVAVQAEKGEGGEVADVSGTAVSPSSPCSSHPCDPGQSDTRAGRLWDDRMGIHMGANGGQRSR